MKIEQRDAYLCQDYLDGTKINELARSYGLSERRVSQILQANNVPRRPRPQGGKKPLSHEHARLGTGTDAAITAVTDHGIEELSEMTLDARRFPQKWHNFLEDFVSDPVIINRVKDKGPR